MVSLRSLRWKKPDRPKEVEESLPPVDRYLKVMMEEGGQIMYASSREIVKSEGEAEAEERISEIRQSFAGIPDFVKEPERYARWVNSLTPNQRKMEETRRIIEIKSILYHSQHKRDMSPKTDKLGAKKTAALNAALMISDFYAEVEGERDPVWDMLVDLGFKQLGAYSYDEKYTHQRPLVIQMTSKKDKEEMGGGRGISPFYNVRRPVGQSDEEYHKEKARNEPTEPVKAG